MTKKNGVASDPQRRFRWCLIAERDSAVSATGFESSLLQVRVSGVSACSQFMALHATQQPSRGIREIAQYPRAARHLKKLRQRRRGVAEALRRSHLPHLPHWLAGLASLQAAAFAA